MKQREKEPERNWLKINMIEEEQLQAITTKDDDGLHHSFCG